MGNIKTPTLTVLNQGKDFKVFQVTGLAGMVMLNHHSTTEAIIVVEQGRAVLNLNGDKHQLKMGDVFVIPAGEAHSLTIVNDFMAKAVMALDAEIKFN